MVDDDVYFDQNGAGSGEFRVFGMEYVSNKEDRAKGYVNWVSQNKNSWTMWGSAVPDNPRTEISQRIVTEEPMSLVSVPGTTVSHRTSADDVN